MRPFGVDAVRKKARSVIMDMRFEKDKGPVMDRGQGFGVGEVDSNGLQIDMSGLDVSDIDEPEIEMLDMDIHDGDEA